MLGRCILWQGPVEAPGTPNSAPFLPVKMSSVVLTCGPSPVMTRNWACGSLSPTLIVIELLLPLDGSCAWRTTLFGGPETATARNVHVSVIAHKWASGQWTQAAAAGFFF